MDRQRSAERRKRVPSKRSSVVTRHSPGAARRDLDHRLARVLGHVQRPVGLVPVEAASAGNAGTERVPVAEVEQPALAARSAGAPVSASSAGSDQPAEPLEPRRAGAAASAHAHSQSNPQQQHALQLPGPALALVRRAEP